MYLTSIKCDLNTSENIYAIRVANAMLRVIAFLLYEIAHASVAS